MASVLSCAVFMGGYVMQHMQPNNKWRYAVYIASVVLAVLAGVFYYQTGLTFELGTSMVVFTGINAVICLFTALCIKK
tara:strand:+ start:432 stop:665 length:234 start_codon:yes stop_codon:yes gene_type:complete